MSKKYKRPNRANRPNRQSAAKPIASPATQFPEEIHNLVAAVFGIEQPAPAAAKESRDEVRAAELSKPYEAACDELADAFAKQCTAPGAEDLLAQGMRRFGELLFPKLARGLEDDAEYLPVVSTILWDRFVDRLLTKLSPGQAQEFFHIPTPFEAFEVNETEDATASRRLMAEHLTRCVFRAKDDSRFIRELDLALYVRRWDEPELLDVVLQTAAPLVPTGVEAFPHPIRFVLRERRRDWFVNSFLKGTGPSKAGMVDKDLLHLFRFTGHRPALALRSLELAKMRGDLRSVETQLGRLREHFARKPQKVSATVEAEYLELCLRLRDNERIAAQLTRMVELNVARPRHRRALEAVRKNRTGMETWMLLVTDSSLHLSPVDVCENFVRDGLLGELVEYLWRTRNLDLLFHYEPDLREDYRADVAELFLSFVDCNEYFRLPTQFEDPYGRPFTTYPDSVDATQAPADIFRGGNGPMYLRREPDPKSDVARWTHILHYMMTVEPGYRFPAFQKVVELRQKYARRKEFAAVWKSCGLWM